jgi:Predicted dehydrogenases and related proteins
MENRRVKWGILGTGRIAAVFATALQVVENSELYAVGSRTQQKAQEFSDKFNVPQCYGSYAELVADPQVDIVYIATPHNLHLENALMAMQHNKHVLCEKPLGVNAKEVQTLIDKATGRKLFLMEALWSRFLPNIIKVKELVASGEIGEIKLLTAAFCFKSSNGPQHRHFNIDLCGGTILDIGIYNMFLSLLLMGEPVDIVAAAGLSGQGVDNSCSCTFSYQNDAMAVMHTSFLADAPIVAEIHGTTGKIRLEHKWYEPGKVFLNRYNETEQVFDFPVKCNGYEYEAIEAAECVLSGKVQSDLWSWKNSLDLVSLMDKVRKQCGVVYPAHDL